MFPSQDPLTHGVRAATLLYNPQNNPDARVTVCVVTSPRTIRNTTDRTTPEYYLTYYSQALRGPINIQKKQATSRDPPKPPDTF